MDISRKDFFRKSLFSLGEAIYSASDILKGSEAVSVSVPDTSDFVSTPHEELSAVACNETCLARKSGCFACTERCQTEAIKLIPGVGIRVNRQLCNGCGTCEYVCPASPKAIRMQARATTVPTQLTGQTGLQTRISEISVMGQLHKAEY